MRGWASAPRQNLSQLMCLSTAIFQSGHIEKNIGEKLLGSWIWPIMHRREALCVVDRLYKDIREFPNRGSHRLSAESRDELLMLTLIAPLLRADMRLPVREKLFAFDAEGSGGSAIVSAPLQQAAAEEIWRFADLHGASTTVHGDASELQAANDPAPEIATRGGHLLIVREASHTPARQDRSEILSAALRRDGWNVSTTTVGTTDPPGTAAPNNLAPSEALRAADRCEFDAVFIDLELRSCSNSRRGVYGIRSLAYPEGIPGLPPDSQKFVEEDNRIVGTAVAIADTASRRGAGTVWAHPYPAHLWNSGEMNAYGERSGSLILDSSMCQFGSKVKQRVGVAVNPRALDFFEKRVQRTCPGLGPDHVHQKIRGRGVPASQLAGAEDLGRPRSFQEALAEGFSEMLQSEIEGRLPQPKKARAICRNPWEERIGDLCEVLPWKVEWAWRESARGGKKLPHINVLELRGRGMIARRLARRVASHHSRALAVGDSRVALGASAKGRSGSFPVNKELRSFLPDLFGGDIFLASFWIESVRNPADNPSRSKDVDPPNACSGKLRDFVSGAAPLLSKDELRAWNHGGWAPAAPPPLGRAEVRFRGDAEDQEC